MRKNMEQKLESPAGLIQEEKFYLLKKKKKQALMVEV